MITFDVPSDSVAGDLMPAFSPTVTDGATVSRSAVRAGPGGMLLLQPDEPTTVRVLNRSGEHTAIHWHGMELENLYDGVVGLGGTPGKRTPAVAPTREIAAGVTHRMRFINVSTGSSGARWQLVRADSTLAEWTRHAKDAIDLLEAQRVTVPARQAVSIGETYDIHFLPSAPGDYRLGIRLASGRLLAQQPRRVVAPRP